MFCVMGTNDLGLENTKVGSNQVEVPFKYTSDAHQSLLEVTKNEIFILSLLALTDLKYEWLFCAYYIPNLV